MSPDVARLELLIGIVLIGTSMDEMDATSRTAIAALILDNMTMKLGLQMAPAAAAQHQRGLAVATSTVRPNLDIP